MADSIEKLTEQWLFDYYADKCVAKSSLNREMDDSSRRFLEVLMSHSIDPDYGQNKTKANMLIVMDYQLQLAELDISDMESHNCQKLFQSKEATTELFDLMNGLRESILNLKDTENSLAPNICNLYQTCLAHLHVYILQVLHRLKTAGETIYDKLEIENYTSTILRKAEKDLASASKEEKAMLQSCQNLMKTNRGPRESLPQLNDLIQHLGQLVQQIHSTLPKPQILKIAESYVRLETKLTAMKNRDLLQSDRSSKFSLEQCAQHNTSSSTDSGRSRPRKGHHKESESSSPEKAGRSKPSDRSRTRSPQSRPSDPDPVEDSPTAGTSRPESNTKQTRKPASHARVKKGPWTPQEEEQFVISVLNIGVGKWTEVKEDTETLRSSVQLKDKWRNIPKSRIRSIALQHKLAIPK